MIPCEEKSVMPAFLVPVDAGQCLIPLEKAIVLIGRQSDCDVSLTNSRKISRRHCCIARVNNKFVVRDLGSTNGVFLNGNRIQKESAIEMGDNLIIGDVRFTLQNEAPVASRSQLNKIANAAPKPNQKAAGVPPIPPPVPSPRRSTSTPLVPKVPDLDDELDDDDASARAPNTLDGIRRYRSKR
jgi:predicted component of type VI protein secretion system